MNRFGLQFLTLSAVALLAPCAVFADAKTDAEQLKGEAIEILKKNSNGQASPKEYASCIFKLEKAQAILENANDNDSQLAQEVSSSLFWARRFSNLEILNELDKLRGAAGTTPKPAKPITPPKPPEPDKTDKAEPAEKDPQAEAFAEAKKAFDAAQQYATANSGDEYAVALRWFQMAAEHPGNDFSLKAIELARAAQMRFAAKKAPTEEKLPDTDEMKPVKEGDELVAKDKFEDAAAKYQSSIKMKDTLIAEKRLGHCYFKRAQQLKDDFLPKYEAALKEYNEAKKNAYTKARTLGGGTKMIKNPATWPAYVEKSKKLVDISKEAQVALKYYEQAETAFRGALKLAPGGKDLDSAGHVGLCIGQKKIDMNVRLRARQYYAKFLEEYKPANDVERSLYEFCKTDLEHITNIK